MIKKYFCTLFVMVVLQVSLFSQEENKKPPTKNIKKFPFRNLSKDDILFSDPSSHEQLIKLLKKNNSKENGHISQYSDLLKKYSQQLKTQLKKLSKNYLNINFDIDDNIKSELNQLKSLLNNNQRMFYPIKSGRFVLEWSNTIGHDLTLKVENYKNTLTSVKYIVDLKLQIYAREIFPPIIKNESLVFNDPKEVGEIVYAINKNGDYSVAIISSLKNLMNINNKLKTFKVISISPIREGAFIFNQNNELVGINYFIENQNIMINGQYLKSKIIPYTKLIPRKYGLGVYGKLLRNGFEIKKVLNEKSGLKVGDIITNVNKIRCDSKNSSQIRKSLSLNKTNEVIVLRGKNEMNVKLERFQFSSNILGDASKKMVYVWIDPLDKNSLKVAKKFIEELQKKYSDIKVKVMYFKLKNKSLYQWLEICRVTEYCLGKSGYHIFDWLIKNKIEDAFNHFSKIEIDLKLKKGILKANSDKQKFKQLIENSLSEGILTFNISSLPALSFIKGDAVEISNSSLDSLLNLYLINCL